MSLKKEKEKFMKDFEKIYLFLYWKSWENIQDCITRMIHEWIKWNQDKEYEKFSKNIEIIIPKTFKRNKETMKKEISHLWLNYWPKILEN